MHTKQNNKVEAKTIGFQIQGLCNSDICLDSGHYHMLILALSYTDPGVS